MTAIHDPIVAVSSPPGRSVRGIVRVSGGDLTPTINALFKSAPTPRTLARCRLSEAVHGCAGLPCLVLYHPGPKSFTGQDTLDALATRFGIEIPDHLRHTALGDSMATAEVFLKMLDVMQAEGIHTLGDAIEAGQKMSRIRRAQNY